MNPFLNIRQVLTKTSLIEISQTPLFSQIEYRCFELGRGRGPQLAYFKMGRPARLVRTPSYLYFYKVDISYSLILMSSGRRGLCSFPLLSLRFQKTMVCRSVEHFFILNA